MIYGFIISIIYNMILGYCYVKQESKAKDSERIIENRRETLTYLATETLNRIQEDKTISYIDMASFIQKVQSGKIIDCLESPTEYLYEIELIALG